jgi:hypothetical protein
LRHHVEIADGSPAMNGLANTAILGAYNAAFVRSPENFAASSADGLARLHAEHRRRGRIPGHNQSGAVHGEGRVRRAVYYRFEFSEQHSDNLIRNEDGSLPSCAHQKVNHPNQKK